MPLPRKISSEDPMNTMFMDIKGLRIPGCGTTQYTEFEHLPNDSYTCGLKLYDAFLCFSPFHLVSYFLNSDFKAFVNINFFTFLFYRYILHVWLFVTGMNFMVLHL